MFSQHLTANIVTLDISFTDAWAMTNWLKFQLHSLSVSLVNKFVRRSVLAVDVWRLVNSGQVCVTVSARCLSQPYYDMINLLGGEHEV